MERKRPKKKPASQYKQCLVFSLVLFEGEFNFEGCVLFGTFVALPSSPVSALRVACAVFGVVCFRCLDLLAVCSKRLHSLL